MALAYAQEREVAIKAVEAASRVCAAVQQTLVVSDSQTKPDKSPVTVGDYAATAVVTHYLKAANFANGMRLIGEEDSSSLQANDEKTTTLRNHIVSLVQEELKRVDVEVTEAQVMALIDEGKDEGGREGQFWCLDPIDGTKGFLRKQQYAVCLALCDKGVPVLGVLGCPNLPGSGVDQAQANGGTLMVAVQGQGAEKRALSGGDAEPSKVSAEADSAQGAFCESVEAAHAKHSVNARIGEALGITKPSVRLDSQCKYAIVARGDAEVYLRLTKAGYVECIWDHAAGYVIVRESGGKVTDTAGNELDFGCGRKLTNNVGIIATSGAFHDKVIASVQGALAEEKKE